MMSSEIRRRLELTDTTPFGVYVHIFKDTIFIFDPISYGNSLSYRKSSVYVANWSTRSLSQFLSMKKRLVSKYEIEDLERMALFGSKTEFFALIKQHFPRDGNFKHSSYEISPIILLRYALCSGINFTETTDNELLFHVFEKHYTLKEDIIKSIILNIDGAPYSKLINIWMESQSSSPKCDKDLVNNQEIYTWATRVKMDAISVDDLKRDEMIAIAAVKFETDLTHVIDVTKLRKELIDLDSYTLSQKYRNTIYDTSTNFSINLPLEAYTLQQLKILCEYYNAEPKNDRLSTYNSLVRTIQRYTFSVPDKIPSLETSSTTTLSNMIQVTEIDIGSYFIYKRAFENDVKYVTIDELIEWFQYTKKLSCIVKGIPLDRIQRISLIECCSRRSISGEKEKTKRKRQHLLTVIEEVLEISNDRIKEIKNICDVLVKEDKLKAIEFLTIVEDMAFYMRGWNGSEDTLPISYKDMKSNSLDSIDKDEGIYTRLVRVIHSREKIAAKMLSLPIVLSVEGSDIVDSPLGCHGNILREKLIQIISLENPFACIRTSSNIICSTIYLAKKFLGIDNRYKLSKLRHIH